MIWRPPRSTLFPYTRSSDLSCAPKYYPEIEPKAWDQEWLGGFFCPCHGSKFDLAGRVYKGVPAPVNLEVPPHTFEGDTLIIGDAV